ncbi:uncharacterized protein N7506_008225 [Penicillium brevicompactum]|uniref:uncharacterized protein n=1 Tax=Penicillium brevicompactum TaxID=5074 RepID=UPI00253F8848|nr:uncharacterized protein N7506_008225 [Penicillium brevicompactum]KAJ5325123.1 hypothetical protein N7506_008225 [Penicillium brevicompactum]
MAEADYLMDYKYEDHSDRSIMIHSDYEVDHQFKSPNDKLDPSLLIIPPNGLRDYSFGSWQEMFPTNFNNFLIDDYEPQGMKIHEQNGARNENNMQSMHKQPGNTIVSNQITEPLRYMAFLDDVPLADSLDHNTFGSYQAQRKKNIPHLNGSFFNHNYVGDKPQSSLEATDQTSSDTKDPLTANISTLRPSNLSYSRSGSVSGHIMQGEGLRYSHHNSLSKDIFGSKRPYGDLPKLSLYHQPHPASNSVSANFDKNTSASAELQTHSSKDTKGLESIEAKRQRRRPTHNLVERRRCDNIKERVQDLYNLIPRRRLEEEVVRQQCIKHGSLCLPRAGTGDKAIISLPAHGTDRCATPRNITEDLLIKEKQRRPNNGQILSGTVSWISDLMGTLYVKYQQEAELAQMIDKLGSTWPFEPAEEDERMRSEILGASDKIDSIVRAHSRGPSNSLCMLTYADITGDQIQSGGNGDIFT